MKRLFARNRLGDLAVALSILAFATILFGTWTASRARSEVPRPRSTADLVEQQINAARKVVEQYQYEDRSLPGDGRRSQTSLWLRRIAQTRREFGGPPGAVLADLKAYADHLKAVETQTEQEEKAGLGASNDLNMTRYFRLEAEVWLSEASEKLGK